MKTRGKLKSLQSSSSSSSSSPADFRNKNKSVKVGADQEQDHSGSLFTTKADQDEDLENEKDIKNTARGFQKEKCRICNLTHEGKDCPLIMGGRRVADAVLPKRAFHTIPLGLESRENPDNSYDVISTKALPSGTQFGPFIAPKTPRFNPSCAFMLKIFKDKKALHFLDTTDLNKCNWMMLVRFSISSDHDQGNTVHNTICYQLKNEIYFSTIAEIKLGESLLVTYSPGYLSMLESSKSFIKPKPIPKPSDADANLKKLESQSTALSFAREEISSPDHDIDHDHDYSSDADVLQCDHSSNKSKENVENVEICELKRNPEVLVDPESKPHRQRRHNFIVQSVRRWSCKYCDVSVESIPSFAAHLIAHFELALVKDEHKGVRVVNELSECDICVSKKTFMNVEIIAHLKLHSSHRYSCHKITTPLKLDEGVNMKDDMDTSLAQLISCPFCPIDVSSKQVFNEHIIKCHTSGIKCKKCSNSFNSKVDMDDHKHNCSKNRRKVSCAICSKTLLTTAQLKSHLQTHNASSFMCKNKNCQRIQTNETFKQHTIICNVISKMESHPSAESVVCPFSEDDNDCPKAFDDPNILLDHVLYHTHPLSCRFCGWRFKSEDSESENHICRKFQCDDSTCKLVEFDCLQDLKKHVHDAHLESKYCIDCAKPFSTREGFLIHSDCPIKQNQILPLISTTSARNKRRTFDAEGKFICEICGAVYTKWNSLKSHRLIHNPKFPCGKCGKTFSRKELLNEHLFVHSSDAQFSCGVCGNKLKTKTSLEVHKKIHQNVKRFQCSVCNKTFAQKVNLLSHERIHNPDREKFPCSFDDCDKYFSSEAYLKIHNDSHKGMENFPCDVCPRKFLRRQILRKHKKAAHGNNRYRCEFCKLLMRHKHSLFRHLNLRHSEFKEKWNAEGYVDTVLIPGDGKFCHPSLRNPMRNKKKTDSPAAPLSKSKSLEIVEIGIGEPEEEEVETDKSDDHDEGMTMTMMAGDFQVGSEVVVGEDSSSSNSIADNNVNMKSPTKPQNISMSLVSDSEQEQMIEITEPLDVDNMEMVFLQLDDDGTSRFVIAFSNQLQ